MSINVRALKREFEIRKWSHIISSNPYVAVVQITGGRNWGRTNMKARVLGEDRDNSTVGTRFASPKLAREAALRTRYVGLCELFRGVPSAVVYGSEIDPVVRVVKRAKEQIDGGLLVGGRFGDAIVTPRVWEEVLQSEGERAEWVAFVKALSTPPGFVRVLDQNAVGLYRSLQAGSGSGELVRVLGCMGEEQNGV